MDPNVTLERIIDAIERMDRIDEREAVLDLLAWLSRGGFAPDPLLVTPSVVARIRRTPLGYHLTDNGPLDSDPLHSIRIS